MTQTTLIERLRKASQCVYLACEKSVADDLCDMLRRAADEIEALQDALITESDNNAVLANE